MTDTIAAVATGMTDSGIGIIRISGPAAITAAGDIFVPKHGKVDEFKTFTMHFGHIFDNDRIIDEVILSIMKGPHSYTGEDVVEINCHGGIVVTKKILKLVLSKGIRPAEPGEFTKRAFLNGRIDLSQAEAVIDIINSSNDMALSAAQSQLSGRLSSEIKSIREEVIYETAYIESAFDDPEHISLDGYADTLLEKTQSLIDKLRSMLSSFNDGCLIKNGISTVIAGKPNAGKSSVLNMLCGHERSIVTHIEGTTRDVVTEKINLGDVTLNLMDTAGIRQTEDIVEKIGVDKSLECLNQAELVLFVVDAGRQLDENDEKIMEAIKDKKVIAVLNKTDLHNVVDINMIQGALSCPVVETVAKDNVGTQALRREISTMFFEGKLRENSQIIISNARHEQMLSNALESLMKVKESILNAMPEDFYTIDLLDAYTQLGYIIGESVDDDLVNEIFARFCTGK